MKKYVRDCNAVMLCFVYRLPLAVVHTSALRKSSMPSWLALLNVPLKLVGDAMIFFAMCCFACCVLCGCI